MKERKNYEMTVEDLDKILEACKPTPLIMLQCGPTRNPQEKANTAWKELRERMGFEFMTVEPTGQDDRFFTAISKNL